MTNKKTSEELGLLESASKSKEAAAVYSDWLEDAGRREEAALWRKKAEVSKILYVLRKKGEKGGGEYMSLSAARGALTSHFKYTCRRNVISYTEWDEFMKKEAENWEIVMLEMVPTQVAILPARKV